MLNIPDLGAKGNKNVCFGTETGNGALLNLQQKWSSSLNDDINVDIVLQK